MDLLGKAISTLLLTLEDAVKWSAEVADEVIATAQPEGGQIQVWPFSGSSTIDVRLRPDMGS